MAAKYNRKSGRMKSVKLKIAHNAYLEDTLFEAVITACAVVAFADGQVDALEREEIIRFVERSPDLSTYTTIETRDAFESRIHEFQLVGGAFEAVLASVCRVQDSLGAHIVICAAENVAVADGCMQPSERTALELIRLTAAPQMASARVSGPAWGGNL